MASPTSTPTRRYSSALQVHEGLNHRSRRESVGLNICWGGRAVMKRIVVGVWCMCTCVHVGLRRGCLGRAGHAPQELGVGDAHALIRGHAQHADFALMHVAMHLIGSVSGLLKGKHLRKHGVDHALGNETVGLPRFLIVGKVGAN